MCKDLGPAHMDWTDGLFTVQILGSEWSICILPIPTAHTCSPT